jgi:mitochondrial fission protein ELM1
LEYSSEAARNLEQLLETLIKMVGKSNQKIDSLEKRVSQLEWLIREQQFEQRDRIPISMYTRTPQHSSEKISFHL